MEGADLRPESYMLAQACADLTLWVVAGILEPDQHYSSYEDEYLAISCVECTWPEPDSRRGHEVIIFDKTQLVDDPIDEDETEYKAVLVAYVPDDDTPVEIESYDTGPASWHDHLTRALMSAVYRVLQADKHLN